MEKVKMLYKPSNTVHDVTKEFRDHMLKYNPGNWAEIVPEIIKVEEPAPKVVRKRRTKKKV